jgi:hypothetical protein
MFFSGFFYKTANANKMTNRCLMYTAQHNINPVDKNTLWLL